MAIGFLRGLSGVMRVCCIAPAILAAYSASAAEPNAAAQIREHLAAGEFAPARTLALAASSPGERDELLGLVARAQGESGSLSASIRTAGYMSDDRARAKMLDQVQSQAGRRGGQQADFDSLIELITTTVAPTTWDEVGGPGAIHEFATGVYVDAEGVLRKNQPIREAGGALAQLRKTAATALASDAPMDGGSPLRKISLTRLEKQVQLALAAGRSPTREMSQLAGLQKIKYVLVYPESGDIVIAGPASRTKLTPEGRVVGVQNGRPVLQLDDLVVVLRHVAGSDQSAFGCSITPTEESLARTQQFLAETTKKPLKPGQRDTWLKKLREQLGRQEITAHGIDPRTRAGQVLIEADYRMKLVGMGLEEGTLGVTSYLDSIKVKRGTAPPPMEVLRWWFTMNYDAIQTTADNDAFELRGQGVQVLSENEMLGAMGKRIHTGASGPLNQQFAQSFTEHFGELAKKYPVYAELQNVFDLALVAALVKSEHLADRARWHQTCFGPAGSYRPTLGPVPQTVETVLNHRVVNDTTILAGVSGGVHADPAQYVKRGAIKTDTYGKLRAEHQSAVPKNLPVDAWWWD